MRNNKKAEESIQYIGGKTLNIILAIAVALFLVFVISRIVYNYISEENDLEKAGKQLQNIIEKIEYVKEVKSDSMLIYPPADWFLVSDSEKDEIDIFDNACLKKSCLCICKDLGCYEDRICYGFDYLVEVKGDYFKTGVSQEYTMPEIKSYRNAIRLEKIEKLRIQSIDGVNEEVHITIKRE